jgi:hypothetical protein
VARILPVIEGRFFPAGEQRERNAFGKNTDLPVPPEIPATETAKNHISDKRIERSPAGFPEY